MVDFLDLLARDAKKTINKGYYNVATQLPTLSVSLKKAILESKKSLSAKGKAMFPLTKPRL